MSTAKDRIEAKLGLTVPGLVILRANPPVIPDHELVRRIGHGAYGEVWMARNALGALRAVKVVYRDHFKDARPYEREFAGIRRFEPLSRANEGFVDILQVGRNEEEGWFYYIMELADDATTSSASETEYRPRTLARDLQSRTCLPLEECLELGLNLCLALAHLHRHGLIHRDVKPSNIIFVGGIPKLADIGLVTEASEANTFVGTEGFVPPEGPTSLQADIYALGKVLYEASMGKDRNEFPEPPSRVGADAESIALMELNAVLLRACAADPKERYKSTEEMHADLALLHSGGSVKRRHSFERRMRNLQRVGTITALLTVIATAAWFWQQRQTTKVSELANANAKLATEKTALAENLARLFEESRLRLARFNIGNGVRLLDQQDPAGALLWFSEALPLLTNNPAQEQIHRIRIQQTLDQTPRLLQVFPHESGVVCAAFSPDGRHLLTGSDRALRLWNATTGELLWKIDSFPAQVHFLRFSKDGRLILASSTQQQNAFNGGNPSFNFASVIDAVSGHEVWSTQGALTNSQSVTCSAFSPDDRWLATALEDYIIRIFRLSDRQLVAELKGHSDQVRHLSFSGDGNVLASASLDRTMRAWRVPEGTQVVEPLPHRFSVVRVCLNHDGAYALTGSFETPGASMESGPAEIIPWNLNTGRRLADPFKTTNWASIFIEPGPNGRAFISAVKNPRAYFFDPFSPATTNELPGAHDWAFTLESAKMASAEADGVAQVFNGRTGEKIFSPIRHNNWLNTIKFSPDEKTLLTGGEDPTARIWKVPAAQFSHVYKRLPAPIQSSNANELDSLTTVPIPLFHVDQSLRLFNEDLNEVHRFRRPSEDQRFRGLGRSKKSNFWALTRVQPDDRALFLWSRQNGTTIGKTLEHPGSVLSFEFTADEAQLMTRCSDQVIRFWRTTDGRLEKETPAPDPINGIVVGFSPDGRTATWAAKNSNAVRFFDLNSGAFVSESHQARTSTFASEYSPDGKKIALLDHYGGVEILDPANGQIISSKIKHSGNLATGHWNPDSRRILTTGGSDIIVWDAITGAQLLAPIRFARGHPHAAHWSEDGRFITAHFQGEARVWDAAAGEPVTPVLMHPDEIAFTLITKNDRLITASYPDHLRAWDLRRSTLPADLLLDYAKFVSGRRISSEGIVLTLSPNQMVELHGSLRLRAPQLFQ